MNNILEGLLPKIADVLGSQALGYWVFLAVGVAMLLLGAHWLVQGAVTISRKIGVPILLVGLTVVAFGTSAPELAFNINAALNNNSALSFGNIVGSNIANIGLVLGLSALVAPLAVHSRVLTKEMPWLLIVTIVAAALPLLGVNYNFGPPADSGPDGYSRIAGGVMLGAFGLFVISWLRMGRRSASQRRQQELPNSDDPLVNESLQSTQAATLNSSALALGALLVGLVLLAVGADVSKFGAVNIATHLGMSEALVGLTIVAVATSLPEVITSLVACYKGHTDLAIGNVVGSNLFNLLLVLGATAVVAPVELPQAPVDSPWISLAVMTLLTFVILPLSLRQKRIDRLEGALLLAMYCGYIGYECWGLLGIGS